MKKFFSILAIVALGLTACNNKETLEPETEPEVIENQEQDAPVYHVSIPASMGEEDVKAVSFDEYAVVSTFLTSDKVYVHNVTKNAWARRGTGGVDGFGYLQPSDLKNEGKSCTLTGDLSFYTWNSSTDSWDAVATLGSTDTYNLYYQAQESNEDLHYSYLDLDGTQSNVSSIDYAQAVGVTMGLSGSTLTLNTNVPFHNYGSMFRQRLSFTGIGSAPTALRYLKVIAGSGQPFISKDYLFSVYNQSTSLSNRLDVFSNSSIMDGNGDVYFAMAFSTPPTGTLNFAAADYSGNFFSGSKALPAGGLENGKYYYGDLALAFDRHQAMPIVTDANSDPVWPGVLDTYSIRNGTTISGDSENFQFYLGASGEVTLTGNGTASMTSGPFLRSLATANGNGNITIILDSNYTIECPTTDVAITTTGKGYLKFATTGGTQTLSITVKFNTAKGLAGTNYTGSQAVSALAADGFIVTLADANPSANPDGTYTFVYTVTPTTVNLASLTSNYTAIDGQVLTGTLGSNVKISIANGATVTLNNATINGENEYSCQWAGLNCLGDATIILKDGTTNTVKGFNSNYPGIHVPSGSTLTIQGTGTLDARSNGWASGIGGGWSIASGNITINGGTITATGGNNGAGIGCGKTPCGNISITGGTVEATGGSNAAGIGGSTDTSCGTITISGGTVTATGGSSGAGIGSGCRQSSSSSCETITISGGCVTAKGGSGSAGIGSGSNASCGDITIENTVTSVSATKGSNSAQNSIGKGYNGTCGTVKFGNVTVYNGSAWSPSPMVAGTYDLLTLAISTTTNTNDTWRLTPISAPVGVVAVDLALPSGLLWASCNVGATSPEQYGDYVAWGETTSKAVYSWDTYAFDNSVNHDGSSLSKYTGSDYSVLRPEDDAARQNWGLNWRMPTKTEWEELINNTDQEWITVSGVKGGKFMKKTNHSVYIFLPATGLHSGNGTWGVGTNGRYWSSSLSLETEVPKKSWLMCCDEGSYKMANDGYRYYGRSVRPVKDAN